MHCTKRGYCIRYNKGTRANVIILTSINYINSTDVKFDQI